MAGGNVLEQKYNELTAQLAAQQDQFNRMMHNQQELQQVNAGGYGDDRKGIEVRLQAMEQRIKAQDDALRAVRQQQDHILRVFSLQDKVGGGFVKGRRRERKGREREREKERA